MTRRILPAAVLLVLAGTAGAQPALPPPASIDPIALQLMQGFPPPAGKVVQLGNLLRPANSRWGFHHLRELGPTVQARTSSTAAGRIRRVIVVSRWWEPHCTGAVCRGFVRAGPPTKSDTKSPPGF